MKVLGCWYSHFDPGERVGNAVLLKHSLASIAKAVAASESAEATVKTCVWTPLGGMNRFEEFATFHRHPNHMGIAQQILRVLYEVEEAGESYDYVCLLEHDVMYPHDYFDRIVQAVEQSVDEGEFRKIVSATYGTKDVTERVATIYDAGEEVVASNDLFGGDPAPGTVKQLHVIYETDQGEFGHRWEEGKRASFPKAKPVGIAHHDYIGLRRTGWCEANQRDEPLHQMAICWPQAIPHFEYVVRQCVLRGGNLLEFNDLVNCVIPYDGTRPAVHINHGRGFTSHPNIYAKAGESEHPYWGAAADYWCEEWPG